MIKHEKYLEEHKACGLKEGDRVRVTRKAGTYENGWANTWFSGKDKCVGQTYEIEKDNGISGFTLKDSHPGFEYGWHFPYFVLEKVEPPKPRGFWNLKAVNEQ